MVTDDSDDIDSPAVPPSRSEPGPAFRDFKTENLKLEVPDLKSEIWNLKT